MELSSDILKDFAEIVNKKSEDSDKKKNTSAYGTAVVTDGVKYVQLDGSDYLTPIAEATEAMDGDRVLVEIKDHRAMVIGNFSYPPSLRQSQEAIDKATNAENAANEAMNNLQDAKDAAEKAEESANSASQKAEEAITKAEESQKASEDAMAKIEEATAGIEELNDEINQVKEDTLKIRDEVKDELEDVFRLEMAEDYAKKTDLVEVEGRLEGKIHANAGELETEFSENYVTKSELVKMEEYLNTKINQNSEEIILSASRTTQLETDTEDIRDDLIAAQNKVREAVRLANESKDAANAAQRDLDKANEELTTAQTELSEALEYYDQIGNKDDATEEEIASAHDAVVRAEQAVNKATADVEAAHTAADAALADAQEAEVALELAKEELAKVSSKVTELEAKIEVNAEAIKLSATKQELTDFSESLNENYYTKEESDAKFTVDADAITSTVTNSVREELKNDISQEVDSKLEQIELGSRNMCLGTSSDYREIALGSDYTTIMRFEMDELCEKHGLVNGDILTYSVFLKTNSGKTITAGWQKYNSSTDRSGEVSEKTIKNGSGRCYVHPVIDTSYEYLDLMVTNVSASITSDTTEYYRCLQLEKGNVPTDWNPAPEDNDINNIEIGGRNLLLDTKAFGSLDESTYSTVLSEKYQDFTVRYHKNSTTNSYHTMAGWYGIYPKQLGQEYTFSFWAKGSGKMNAVFSGPTGTLECVKNVSSQGVEDTDGSATFTLSNDWIRYWVTFTLADTGDITIEKYVRFVSFGGSEVYICGPKLELGNKATDWTPAPEDVDNAIDIVIERVVEAETKIQQNADSISLSATKTEVETMLSGYYTKEESEAKFTVDSDGITSIVKTEITKIDFGGRNLLLDSELIEHVRTNTTQPSLYPNPVLVNSDYALEILKDGGEFTLSFDYEITGITSSANLYWMLRSNTTATYTSIANSSQWLKLTVGDNIGHYSVTFTPTDDIRQYGTDWMISGLTPNKNADAVFRFKHIKFEKGNKATDWTPAPEDMATGEEVDSVQDNLNETAGKVDDLDTKVVNATSEIEQLSYMISMMVTDENGNSLMTQTSEGWTFDISGIQENVANNGDAITKLQELISTLSATTGGLEEAVGNLQETSEYIWLTTYEDEPCIALGESDSSYGLFITNTRIIFIDGSGNPTYISKDGLYTNKLTVETEFRQKNFIWSVRQNGNYGLMWKQLKAVSITAFYSGGGVPIGTSLNALTDIIVRITYNDGTVGRTADYKLSGEILEGPNTITVTYDELSTTFTVTGLEGSEVEVTLSSISARYTGGSVVTGTAVSSLKSSLTVTATYSDGSTATVTNYTLSGSITNVGNNTITVSYGGKTTTFVVVGYAQSSGSSGLVMRTGTITDATTINTGLSSISQLVLYRPSVASTGMIDAVYNVDITDRYSYCSSYGSYDIKSGGIFAFAPTISGGTFTWPYASTSNYGLASGVAYTWIAYGTE